MINNEPNIFKIIPMFVSLILHSSARPPAPTTNIPENKAVILTAILTVPISVLKLSSSIGTTLTNDCARAKMLLHLEQFLLTTYYCLQMPLLTAFPSLFATVFEKQTNSITEICLFHRIIEWFLILMCKTLNLLVVHPFILNASYLTLCCFLFLFIVINWYTKCCY